MGSVWKKNVGSKVFVSSFFLESENFLDEHFIHEVGETIESNKVANMVFLDVIHDFCLELCSRSQDAVYLLSKERRAEDLRLLFFICKQSREMIFPPLFGKVVLIFTHGLGGLLFMVASRNVNDHTRLLYIVFCIILKKSLYKKSVFEKSKDSLEEFFVFSKKG